MSSDIRIPQMGIGMVETTLVSWSVIDGAAIKKGEVIYTLENEKAVEEIESPASGTIRILAAPETVYPIGALIGRIE